MKLKYLILLLIISTLALQCFSKIRSFGRKSSKKSKVKMDPRWQNMTFYEFMIAEPEVNDPSHVIRTSNGLSYTVEELLTARRNSWIILGIVGTFALCIICCCLPSCDSRKNRHLQIKEITDEFELINDDGSSLSENQRSKSIEKIMTTKWKVQLTYGQTSLTSSWQFKIKNINKKTDTIYKIDGVGFNEEKGTSTNNGILLFKGNGMGICFDKLYSDRQKARQVGKWDLLIFEGLENNGVFEGQWYFKGFKKDDQFSGKMKILPN